MDIAEVVAKRSACLRNNVGAVVVNEDNNIVAIGYNGPAAGVPQCLKENCIAGCDIAIHAEDNAILRMPEIDYGPYNYPFPEPIYRIFCTVSPCRNCAKLIKERGDIRAVYYRYPYRDMMGVFYLLSNDIKVYQILSGGILNEQKL